MRKIFNVAELECEKLEKIEGMFDKIKELEYNYNICGIAKSVPYVTAIERYVDKKLTDVYLLITMEIDESFCEKRYIHGSGKDALVAYKRYVYENLKRKILLNLIGFPDISIRTDMAYNALINKLNDPMNNTEYDNIKYNFMGGVTDMISLYDMFDSLETFMYKNLNTKHTLITKGNVEIVINMNDNVTESILLQQYRRDGVHYTIEEYPGSIKAKTFYKEGYHKMSRWLYQE